MQHVRPTATSKAQLLQQKGSSLSPGNCLFVHNYVDEKRIKYNKGSAGLVQSYTVDENLNKSASEFQGMKP